jgi:folate-binding protein YgfZ
MEAAVSSQIAGDYELARTGAVLVDQSERGKLALTGAEAAEFLHGQVSNDITGLAIGQGCYAAFLTPKGKMLGDLRVLAVSDPSQEGAIELLLDTERVALQALFDTLRLHRIGFRAELHKRTLQRGLLSLIGPAAEACAVAAAGAAPGEGENSSLAAVIAGHDVLLVRTHNGVDVLCPAEDTDAVRSALIAGGAVAVAAQVADIVRVEAGRPRYGIDLDDSVIPQEAALNERAVSFTKGCYVGQETVARLFYKGKPTRHLRGLLLDGAVASGAELRLADRVVGTVGSCVVSPRLGAIGLAIVRREAEPGARLAVGDAGAGALVTELPFPDERQSSSSQRVPSGSSMSAAPTTTPRA